jgi:apolipoprotein N-acyltransferase
MLKLGYDESMPNLSTTPKQKLRGIVYLAGMAVFGLGLTIAGSNTDNEMMAVLSVAGPVVVLVAFYMLVTLLTEKLGLRVLGYITATIIYLLWLVAAVLRAI